jgi:hypothetical protein
MRERPRSHREGDNVLRQGTGPSGRFRRKALVQRGLRAVASCGRRYDSDTMESPTAHAASVGARCGRCGYSTAGLTGTQCPECAFDLTKSAYLRYTDRGWLTTIVRGTHLIRVGATGTLVLCLGGAKMVLSTVQFVGLSNLSERLVYRVLLIGFLASCAIGAWMLTVTDPTFGDPDAAWGRHRLLGRVGILTAASLALARALCEGILSPIACSALTIGALLSVFAVLRPISDLVRSLIRRSESATPEDLEEKGALNARSLLRWTVAGVILILLVTRRIGLATLAARLESLALGIGFILSAIAFLKLLRGTRAIREELAKA